jgi:phosphoglycerate dehydrogenase-like enzyme
VAVTDYLAEWSCETRVLDPLAELILTQTTDELEVVRRAGDADVFLVFHDIKLTERSISQFPNCKGIIRCGVGFDNVDLEASGRRGIVVCNVPDYGTEEVADHALLLLIALARRLVPAHESIRRGAWDPTVVFGAPRLRRKTLGLVGCGRIGSAMALRAKAIGMRVVFFDPYVADGREKALGVERTYGLVELLEQSEFLSLHCPLTAETYHLLNDESLSRLPQGAYVINTARGPCVDGAALIRALDSGWLASAALDVVEREPLDDERIRRHPQILLTPHAAFYSAEGYIELRTKAAMEAKRILLGEPVRNPVNLPWLQNPRCPVPEFARG